MALSAIRKCLLGPQYKFILKSNPAYVVSNNAMSVFSENFLKPVFNKKQLDELIESGEAEDRRSVPIIPPQVSETCSQFYDDTTGKMVNYVMKMGQKKLARELMEQTFEIIKRTQIRKYHSTTDIEEKKKIELDPKVLFHQAILNCQPLLQLTPVKRGGVKYQVPVAISDKRSRFVAMRWMVHTSREKEGKMHFPDKLAREILDASQNRGRVVKRKQDLHKQCEANRAYAHYRWN